MKFRTEVDPPNFGFSLSHQDKILLLGSCFSDNIGSKLQYFGFDVVINPCGTVFNVCSIEQLIKYAVENEKIDAKQLHFHPQSAHYFHFAFHSRLNHRDQIQALDNVNNAIQQLRQSILDAKVLFVTMGTSYAYFMDDTVVANCHKMPAHLFHKRLISINEQLKSLSAIEKLLIKINPECQMVLTLSPVRHIKDGIVENSLSKSIARCAIAQAVDKGNIHYFPSYEMVMDDLRDYRYYSDDLIHINSQGIEYVWSKFKTTFFDHEVQANNKLIDKIRKDKLHRSITMSTESQELVNKTNARIEQLISMYPYMSTVIKRL